MYEIDPSVSTSINTKTEKNGKDSKLYVLHDTIDAKF